ncbi:hypothetical protein [Kitasatospora sp. MBT63]|uniref:hypothetical protein n=1 Tax=Kitasatospora sp. MBT63 TaxID=1444768 RepID=UPI00068A48AA|nr:hypothetical protein [Kitasatospora sp. MBT63]
MPAPIDPAVAAAQMISHGVEPLAPYPGSAQPWPCRCLTCGSTVTPRLASIRKGQGACRVCAARKAGDALRVPAAQAAADMRAAGYEPLDPYPGNVGAPWRSSHQVCGRVVTPRLADIRRGVAGCPACARRGFGATRRLTAETAVELMRAADFEPLEDYPGSTRPWPSVHTPCGCEGEPSVTEVRAGDACWYCATHGALALAEPASVFVAANTALGAVKVGITGDGSRIGRLLTQGWTLTARFELPTGRQALEVECQVLRHLRENLALPCANTMAGMIGRTESVNSDDLPADRLADLVAELVAARGSRSGT